MKRKDWTLLAVAAANGEALTPVQLQKSLFLLGKKMPREVKRGFYRFEPYNYGPFCRDIYTDAELLETEGLIRIDRVEPGRSWAEYSARPDGIGCAGALRKQSPKAVKYLEDVVAWALPLSFGELVGAIYKEFPEQKANSVFQTAS